MDVQLNDAKSALRGLGKDIIERNGKFAVHQQRTFYTLEPDELEDYLLRKHELRRTCETQVFASGYYEHVVRIEGNNAPRRLQIRRGDPFVLESGDGLIQIQFGRLSSLFCLGLTDVDKMNPELRRFTLGMGAIGRLDQERALGELFRVSSIRVTAPADSAIGKSAKRLHELAEAAAFHIAFGYGISISFTKSWDRTYYWLGRKEVQDVQFPLRTYNSELVAYYNLALASDSLILGYLALYKILEYFYTSVTEAALHRKLREHLVAPDFSPNKTKKLRDLVKAVRQFESRTDELSALKLVLEEHFEKLALRQWVQEYEAAHGPYFSSEVSLFGTLFKLDTNDGSIIPNLASRIYAIRNALVHNKEGEVGRFIPYTGQEEILSKEVQILQFLAETLIVRTGTDIS